MSFSYSIFIRILKSLSLQDQMQALREERTVLKVTNQGLEGPGGWAAEGEHREQWEVGEERWMAYTPAPPQDTEDHSTSPLTATCAHVSSAHGHMWLVAVLGQF